MSLLRLYIADDEPLALDRLRTYFADIPGVEIVGTGASGEEAFDAAETLAPDIMLLDIQMPGLNGLRVAASLPPERRPEIIFVTAFEHYAADAFAVDATDYLLKPVQFDRLWQAIERAKRRRYLRNLADRAGGASTPVPATGKDGHDDGIWVQSRSGALFVPTDSIDWIEAQRDYVLLHTPTRSHMVRMSMRALEERLDSGRLMRVHRSAFARPENVVEVQKMGRAINALVLRDGAIVQVGPNYARAVAGRLGMSGRS